MRIAILGAGNVGGGLGKAFAAVGHEVVFGVRDPESTKTLAALARHPGRDGRLPARGGRGRRRHRVRAPPVAHVRDGRRAAARWPGAS